MDRLAELDNRLPLFPNQFRFAGYLLILIGLGSAYLYYWGGRSSFFEIPVLAVVTSYAETRWFVLAQTNLLDEMALIFLLTGLLFAAFSKEKIESKKLDQYRIKALFCSVYGTAAIWMILYLTIFGWPMMIISASMFILFLVFYIIIFGYLKRDRSIEMELNKPGNKHK